MTATLPQPRDDLEQGAPALRRTRKTQKKRDEIIAAAIRVINARTYALATMTEIAAELGLRDATLYYYFPSKQALFYACHLQSIARFQIMLNQADNAGLNGAGKLDCFFVHLVEGSDRFGSLLYFGDYFHLEPEHREHVSALISGLTDDLERFLKQGIDDGSIAPCDTRLIVQLISGMLIWLAKWVPTVSGMSAVGLIEALRMFSLQGLTPRPMEVA